MVTRRWKSEKIVHSFCSYCVSNKFHPHQSSTLENRFYTEILMWTNDTKFCWHYFPNVTKSGAKRPAGLEIFRFRYIRKNLVLKDRKYFVTLGIHRTCALKVRVCLAEFQNVVPTMSKSRIVKFIKFVSLFMPWFLLSWWYFAARS